MRRYGVAGRSIDVRQMQNACGTRQRVRHSLGRVFDTPYDARHTITTVYYRGVAGWSIDVRQMQNAWRRVQD